LRDINGSQTEENFCDSIIIANLFEMRHQNVYVMELKYKWVLFYNVNYSNA